MEEGNVAPTKRKYVRRVPVCTDPELKYRYKKKPGPRPGLKRGRKIRKKYEPKRTDAEQRRFSRASAAAKKAAAYDPEKRRARLALTWAHGNYESRRGIPDGWNREQADAAWAVARAKAEEFYDQMVEEGIVTPLTPDDYERVYVTFDEEAGPVEVLVPKTDEAKAHAALKEAMVMALGPMGTQQTKLSAINTVLKFTKSPPAQKVEVSKAEDLLAAAIADMKGNGD